MPWIKIYVAGILLLVHGSTISFLIYEMSDYSNKYTYLLKTL